jgi:hypothetical protein
MVKASGTFQFEKVINSCVEKFVEIGMQPRISRLKHSG